MISPLEPTKFFKGIWTGKGEFRPRSLLRLFIPDQAVEYRGITIWLTDTLWMAQEEFRLSVAGRSSRMTFMSIIGPGRLHMTSDDVPGGADILLSDTGFRFTPYLFRSRLGRGYIVARCLDEVT